MGEVMAEPTSITTAGTTQTSGQEFAGGGEITIVVGAGDDHQTFRTRRDLLIDHSDYFRSLFMHEQEENGDVQSGRGADVLIPNISPEIFGKILNFVETGRLDLTPENIYAMLLAAHLLHMPRAVELCRTYLVFERHRLLSTPPLPPPPPSIVKPIPSRKYYFWPPPPPPPSYFPFLPPVPPPHYATALYVPSQTLPIPTTHDHNPAPSTSVVTVTTQDATLPNSKTPPSIMTTTSTATSPTKKSSVYKDIACCDGPVRFKRVLNANYGAAAEPLLRALPAPKCTDHSNDKIEKNATPENDERRDNRRSFVCRFCKHTFKSHYCFRKHTRRHLNPVTPDRATVTNSVSNTTTPSADAASDENDFVQDMNVQYYPCKTCGSKFPSYYFVHKHRKNCHGSENSNDGKASPASTTTSQNNDEDVNKSHPERPSSGDILEGH